MSFFVSPPPKGTNKNQKRKLGDVRWPVGHPISQTFQPTTPSKNSPPPQKKTTTIKEGLSDVRWLTDGKRQTEKKEDHRYREIEREREKQ